MFEKTTPDEMGYQTCDADHNDRSQMTAIFKGDALVDWVCRGCLKLNHKEEDFDNWLERMGYTT